MANSEDFQAEPSPERPPPVRPRRPRRDDDEDGERFRQSDDPVSTIIPYKNVRALAAYYCGVFGLIPFVGAVLGPIALILGILGLRYVKANPAAKGTGHAIAGIVLGIIDLYNWVLVIFFVVGIILAATHK